MTVNNFSCNIKQAYDQKKQSTEGNETIQGMKLIFFSDIHLAPKFFKVVANSKKVGCHF